MDNKELIFLAKIQQSITLLNEIDDIIESNSELQQTNDWEISDYLHIFEDKYNNLTDESKLVIDDNLFRCRSVRRQLKNIFEISKVYNQNRDKLRYKNQREFLSNQIKAIVNKLHCDYKYRVLDNDTVDNIINTNNEVKSDIKKKTRGKQACISKEELQAKLDSGMKSNEIAKELGVQPNYISILKRKFGMTRVYKKRG